MNYLFSIRHLMRSFSSSIFMETGTVHEIEMIKLSSWEWFLLLSIITIIIWLLLLYQVRSTRGNNFGIQSEQEQETKYEPHNGDGISGEPGSYHEE